MFSTAFVINSLFVTTYFFDNLVDKDKIMQIFTEFSCNPLTQRLAPLEFYSQTSTLLEMSGLPPLWVWASNMAGSGKGLFMGIFITKIILYQTLQENWK